MFFEFGLIKKIFFIHVSYKYTLMPIKQLYLTPTHPFYDEFITLENQKLLLYCYFTEGSTDQLTVRAKMCLLYLIILKVPRHAVAMWPYILHL